MLHNFPLSYIYHSYPSSSPHKNSQFFHTAIGLAFLFNDYYFTFSNIHTKLVSSTQLTIISNISSFSSFRIVSSVYISHSNVYNLFSSTRFRLLSNAFTFSFLNTITKYIKQTRWHDTSLPYTRLNNKSLYHPLFTHALL